MRFIQMWMPSELGLEPGVEQKVFTEEDGTDRLLKVIGGDGGDAVLVHQRRARLPGTPERGRRGGARPRRRP